MLLESRFKNITTLFYNGDYVEGQKELSQLIKVNPSDPILHANRALFNSQLNNDEQAIRDLQKAIDIQPMNYISYFNLFSILVKLNEEKLAVRNINCSLSVMYTMIGRHRKSMEDVHRAIQLADNNIQARVLKGLLLLDNGLYQQSKKQFQRALTYSPGHCIIQELLSITVQKIDPEHAVMFESCSTIKGPRRLLCDAAIPDDCLLTDMIKHKVAEFNVLYVELNNQIGGLTQKVPKEHSFYQQVDPNTMDKSKEDREGENNSVIASLVEERYEKDEKQEEGRVTESLPMKEDDSSDHKSAKTDHQYISKNYVGARAMVDQEDEKEMASFSQTSYSHGIDQPRHSLANSEQISITVLNFDFFEPQNVQHLQQVYAILSYNNNRDKLITKPVPCEAGVCSWNKTFTGIAVSGEPAPLKIKLYNKQRNQIRDLFLGEFEVLLNTADLLKIPLQDRKGVPIGDMLLQVSPGGETIQ